MGLQALSHDEFLKVHLFRQARLRLQKHLVVLLAPETTASQVVDEEIHLLDDVHLRERLFEQSQQRAVRFFLGRILEGL